MAVPNNFFFLQILSLGYGLSFWPIPVMANIGGAVATEFGSPNKSIWFIPAWTLSITICFMIWYACPRSPSEEHIRVVY